MCFWRVGEVARPWSWPTWLSGRSPCSIGASSTFLADFPVWQVRLPERSQWYHLGRLWLSLFGGPWEFRKRPASGNPGWIFPAWVRRSPRCFWHGTDIQIGFIAKSFVNISLEMLSSTARALPVASWLLVTFHFGYIRHKLDGGYYSLAIYYYHYYYYYYCYYYC